MLDKCFWCVLSFAQARETPQGERDGKVRNQGKHFIAVGKPIERCEVKIIITIIGMIAAILGCLGFIIGTFGGSPTILTGGIVVMIISVYLIAIVAQGDKNV